MSDFTHLESSSQKPDSYKNLNSSQVSNPIHTPISDETPKNTTTPQETYYVISYNKTPKFITKTQEECDKIMHENTLKLFNKAYPSYIDLHLRLKIIITESGYQIIEYYPFLPHYYDNILLSITSHKVNSI